MVDSWEDWENDDFEVPVLKTQEHLKRLKERKLVEEDDNALARDLFQDEDEKDLTEPCKLVNNSKAIDEKTNALFKNNNPEKAFNKQKENEEKQKELSKKLKEEKVKREKTKAIFGETEEDNEFTEYEDKFY